MYRTSTAIWVDESLMNIGERGEAGWYVGDFESVSIDEGGIVMRWVDGLVCMGLV